MKNKIIDILVFIVAILAGVWVWQAIGPVQGIILGVIYLFYACVFTARDANGKRIAVVTRDQKIASAIIVFALLLFVGVAYFWVVQPMIKSGLF